jgi:glucose/arabinose dehydrogenase
MQGFEERGSRPMVNDSDYLYLVSKDRWYGWPDYSGGRSVTAEAFQKPSRPVTPLLAQVPEQPPAPIASFPAGHEVNGIVFPRESFGLRGDGLVGLSAEANGRIVRVDLHSGKVEPFLWNQSGAPPTLWRPYAFASAKDGSIYMVDQGRTRPSPTGSEVVPGTGALWQITQAQAPRSGQSAPHHWRWALTGMVLSIAGTRLVARKA